MEPGIKMGSRGYILLRFCPLIASRQRAIQTTSLKKKKEIKGPVSPAWAPPWSQPGERAWVPQPGNMGLPLFGSTTCRRWWSGWLQCVSGSSGRWAERVCLYHLAACMLFFPSRQEHCFLVPSHCGLSPDIYTYVPNDSSGCLPGVTGCSAVGVPHLGGF